MRKYDHISRDTHGLLSYDYPIREDMLVWLWLPRDLTQIEADRLKSFLQALVIPDSETDGEGTPV